MPLKKAQEIQTPELTEYLNVNTDSQSNTHPKITVSKSECQQHIDEGIPAYDPPLRTPYVPWEPTEPVCLDYSPERLFWGLFPEGIVDAIIVATNRHASRDSELDKTWRDTTKLEIRRWIGLRIEMAAVRLDELKDYWNAQGTVLKGTHFISYHR